VSAMTAFKMYQAIHEGHDTQCAVTFVDPYK
jgi:hypothetical protein